MQEVDELKKRLSFTENVLQNLARSEAIPRDIETAFTERLPFLNASLGTTTPGDTVSFSAFPVVAPANPSGALKVQVGSTIYNLLYK